MAALNKKNMVHEMARWKTRCASELESAAIWQENWGFLIEDRKKEEEAAAASAVSAAPETATPPEEKEPKHRLAEKERFNANKQKVPRETLGAPNTTSHQYGWYPNVEVVKTGGYGLKRCPELVAET